jgi:hypothetical protein
MFFFFPLQSLKSTLFATKAKKREGCDKKFMRSHPSFISSFLFVLGLHSGSALRPAVNPTAFASAFEYRIASSFNSRCIRCPSAFGANMILPHVPSLKNIDLVLASSSPRRKEILNDILGLRVRVVASTFEENLDKSRYTPQEYGHLVFALVISSSIVHVLPLLLFLPHFLAYHPVVLNS